MGKIRLSFVICTYNRAPYVRRLIMSVVGQMAAFKDVELVVVDNNCRDNTAEVVNWFVERYPRVRYVLETKQGLSNARNGGAAAARGEYLLFLDDDAVTPEHFVKTMRDTVIKQTPDLFGGPIYPLYADAKPDWFPEHLEIREKAPKTGFHLNVTISGGNFGIRKSILDKLGGFDPRFGMSGSKVGMLEERLVVDKYKALTPTPRQKIFYHLDGWILHHTPLSRMTPKFQLKRIYVADYQSTNYAMSKACRSPFFFLRCQIKRTTSAFFSSLPTLMSAKGILEPADQRRFESLIRLNYTWAKTRAALAYCLFGARTEIDMAGHDKKGARGVQPLRVLWITMPESGSVERAASREAKLHRFMENMFDKTGTSVTRMHFDTAPKTKVLWSSIINAGVEAYDFVLFEDRVPHHIGEMLRTHYATVQVFSLMLSARFMRRLDELPRGRAMIDGIKKQWNKLKQAREDDRATMYFSDRVVTSSRSDMHRWLPWVGKKKKLVYMPPVLPDDVLQSLGEVSTRKADVIICVGDVKPTPTSLRHAERAAAYYTAAGGPKTGVELQLTGKVKQAFKKEIEGVNILNLHKNYHKFLGRAVAVFYPDKPRDGQPTRFLEALCVGAPIILPVNCKSVIDERLHDWIIEFNPKKPETLRTAIEAAQNFDKSIEDGRAIVESLRENALSAWSELLEEARKYAVVRPAQEEMLDSGGDILDAEPRIAIAS